MRTHRTLKAWTEANQLARLGIRLARDHWKPYAAGAFTQLQHSSLSVQLNIAEGYSRFTKPQFRQYLLIAYSSAIEAGEILELLAEEQVIDSRTAREGVETAVRCQQRLMGLLKRLREVSPPR